jgi:ribonuclease III
MPAGGDEKGMAAVVETEDWRERARAFARDLAVPEEHEELVFQALTHRSVAGAPQGNNERLEFLGDSVLSLLVSEYLFRSLPGEAEGRLTRQRAKYVSEPSLARAAEALGLGPLLALAPNEEMAGARSRASALSDAFEAVLAAVYLARGLEGARRFVQESLLPHVDPAEVWDYKSRLQELCQEEERLTPEYRTEIESGPAHERIFRSEVWVGDRMLGTGAGRSKKHAEQEAASAALDARSSEAEEA